MAKRHPKPRAPAQATDAPEVPPVGPATRQQVMDLRARILDLHTKGDVAAARPLYARYLSHVPQDGQMWSNLGALMRKEGQHDIALNCQRRAVALQPGAASVRNNLANILSDIGHNAEALELRKTLIEETPDDQQLRAMIGKTLRSLGRAEESCAHLEKVWAEAPDYTEHGIQLALSQLAAGDYARGFATYDVRWQTDELTPRALTQPKWDMQSSLKGRTIMVLPEQGFGDGICFARFLPVLRRFEPEAVVFIAEKPVRRIYEGVEGADYVGLAPPDGVEVDCWINIMDLPTLYFADESDVPPPTALHIPDDSTARAKMILAPFTQSFNVGVVWTGSVTYRGNAFRSFSHREFHALLDVPDVQMFSLYKGPEVESYRADGTAHLIFDEGSTERDFGDCAAMMRDLDLVITSDTATAHLAGSLGVPVWTLLHWDAFWLWQLERDRTPWYPEMELFRQETPRDWAEVFTRVRARLDERVADWRKERG